MEYTLTDGKVYKNTPQEVNTSELISQISRIDDQISILTNDLTRIQTNRADVIATLQSIVKDVPTLNTVTPEVQDIPEVASLLTPLPVSIDPGVTPTPVQ